MELCFNDSSPLTTCCLPSCRSPPAACCPPPPHTHPPTHPPRLDDALPFWLFTWAAPFELVLVLTMVTLELGFLPALAGISTTLALIPLQVRGLRGRQAAPHALGCEASCGAACVACPLLHTGAHILHVQHLEQAQLLLVATTQQQAPQHRRAQHLRHALPCCCNRPPWCATSEACATTPPCAPTSACGLPARWCRARWP